ncbi:hypothetical protein V5A12_04285, partial [Streptococcus mitis]
MNKKKMILTSLASVAILGAGFVASQPTVVKAEDAPQAVEQSLSEKQQEFLSNFNKAAEAIVKELKEYLDNAKGDSELENQIQGFIDEFEKRTKAQKADYEERFKKGLTAEDAEKEVEEKAKEEEVAEEQEAKEEAAAQKEFLSNFDKAAEAIVKELKEYLDNAKGDSELQNQIQGFIDEFEKRTKAQKADYEERFKKGLTAEDAEKEVEEKAKEEEVAEEQEAKEEEAAQQEFLANFDKALKDAVSKLEEDAKNNPEIEEQIQDTIAKLKAEADKTKAKIVEGFKQGLTAEDAEKAIDDANKKSAEEEKAAQEEFLANYDAALKAAIAELEKAETNSPEEAKAKADTIAALKAASDETRKQIVEGFKKGLTAKQAEKFIDVLNKKAAEEDKAKEKPA